MTEEPPEHPDEPGMPGEGQGAGQHGATSAPEAQTATRAQPTEAELRMRRAAQKLRENLARRKRQVRARRKGEAETGIGLPAAGDSLDEDEG